MSEHVTWTVALMIGEYSCGEIEGHINLGDVSGTTGEVFAMCATMVAEQIREALLAEAKE